MECFTHEGASASAEKARTWHSPVNGELIVSRIPHWELRCVHLLMNRNCSRTPGKMWNNTEHACKVRLEWWVGCSEGQIEKEMNDWKCFLQILQGYKKFLEHLLQQKMTWRSDHGLDLVGIGNTGFSFEETLRHQQFHNYQQQEE